MSKLDKRSYLSPATDELGGRAELLPRSATHFVNGHHLIPPYPEQMRLATFGLGCFWGAERRFWSLSGVWVTAVGYAGGETPYPTYRDVCSGQTGHAEVVRVVYDPNVIQYEALLRCFWESHDPTQGLRQGNDVGPQYRSLILTEDEYSLERAKASRRAYQASLNEAGFGAITTEIAPIRHFYFAEDYHQQYLARNPGGYCGLGGTRVSCPPAVLWPTASDEDV